MSEDISELRATAEEGARLAGRILAERFHQARTIEFKGGIDLVTDADRASEAALLAFLRERHPEHAFLAEESGASAGSGIRWVVDPLDGTTNYAHQVPHFCVSVGAESGGVILAGAIYDPVRSELFSAAKGQGATLNGAPIRASDTANLHRALLCTGFPYDVREKPEAPVGLFRRIITRVQGVRRMGSAALDLAYVAAGRYDAYWEFGLKPWDVAAGALIVWEAGGVLCNIDGTPYTPFSGDILASNHALAERIQHEVGSFLREVGYVRR
jgi:myo-inositol-1(or 4)-monophosphatase